MKQNRDRRIDDYIARSERFARPILRRLRALVHQADPESSETLKWGFPHFLHDGKILCSMAAFKAHCAFGFWHDEMRKVLAADGVKSADAMGSLGRVTSLAELPSARAMLRYLQRAVELNESGEPARASVARKPKPEAKVPSDLAAALKKSKQAAATFTNFSPSHRREYIEWITEAKRDETRQKRLASTIEQLAAGKSRHWKYAGR